MEIEGWPGFLLEEVTVNLRGDWMVYLWNFKKQIPLFKIII